jgi:hypothetical protein
VQCTDWAEAGRVLADRSGEGDEAEESRVLSRLAVSNVLVAGVQQPHPTRSPSTKTSVPINILI